MASAITPSICAALALLTSRQPRGVGRATAFDISAVSWAANRLDLVAVGTDSAVWHKKYG